MSFFQEKHFLVEFCTVFYADKFIKESWEIVMWLLEYTPPLRTFVEDLKIN